MRKQLIIILTLGTCWLNREHERTWKTEREEERAWIRLIGRTLLIQMKIKKIMHLYIHFLSLVTYQLVASLDSRLLSLTGEWRLEIKNVNLKSTLSNKHSKFYPASSLLLLYLQSKKKDSLSFGLLQRRSSWQGQARGARQWVVPWPLRGPMARSLALKRTYGSFSCVRDC